LDYENKAFTQPYQRLDAFEIACQARKVGLAFTQSLPRGFGGEAQQINRASASVVRNLCEGAGRWRPAEKILKFEIASGEVSEAVGAVQSLTDCGLGDVALAVEFETLQGRVGAMLTGLIKRQRR